MSDMRYVALRCLLLLSFIDTKRHFMQISKLSHTRSSLNIKSQSSDGYFIYIAIFAKEHNMFWKFVVEYYGVQHQCGEEGHTRLSKATTALKALLSQF